MLVMDGWRFDVIEGRREAAREAAAAALEGLIAGGLAFVRARDGGRLFDPAEVWNRLIWATLAGPGSVFEDLCVSCARRECWEGREEAGDQSSPPPLDPSLSRAFKVTISRAFNLAGAGLRPGERARLRLPAPLPDAALDILALEALPPPEAEAVFGPARLDVVLPVPESGEVAVGMSARFNARATTPQTPARLDRADAELFTRPIEGLIRVSPRVAAMAERLAVGASGPLAIVRRFWDFMIDEFACGAIHYDTRRAHALDRALDQGWYDCQVGSALLVALCRARGIPARLVSGYLLQVAAPAFHTWLEAWIEDLGWVPLDLQAWQVSAGGRDRAWREHYFGRIDERMVVERPPRLFGGTGAVRLSTPWQMVTTMTARGSLIEFETLDTGDWIYREEIVVERIARASTADVPSTWG